METPGAGVVAQGVQRRFGPVEAVRGLDLTAPYGEVTALVGPNGSGKTTLLLMLASLLVPDAGTIRVGGHDPVTESAAVRSVTGWSPDVFGVYDNLTVREYVEFFAAAYRLPKAVHRTRADELLAQSHLLDYADRPVHVLSRGQKQRLGLTRALVHRPRVLLLDEPASGLDPRSRIELRDLLRRLAAEGAAVLVSSHILSDLEEVADRVVFIEHGRSVGEHRLSELTSLHQAQGRLWKLRALDTPSLVAALDRLAVAYEMSAPGNAEVHLPSDDAAAALLRDLVVAGVPVVAFAPADGHLEAAYLQLTGEERR